MVVKLTVLVAISVLFQTLFFDCAKKSGSNAPAQQEVDTMAPAMIFQNNAEKKEAVVTGAERLEEYLPGVLGKNVALVVNHTSRVGARHLLDTLLARGVQVSRVFAPEHGFRGTADAGKHLQNMKDPETGIPIVSLYGDKKKPTKEDLKNIGVVIFDIQDVGARFYTYLSTMCYVMEACAENKVPLLLLDRPNPNGHYVDGPVLRKSHRSFVGLHEVPVVHGMTLGEYAGMVLGEGWLNGGAICELTVIPCKNYDHRTFYELPVPPSPNLPNMRAVYLYPSLCFFEGTVVSVGRGTDKQFQVIGAPGFNSGNFTFKPEPRPGAKNPPHVGQLCRGFDLSYLPAEDLQMKSHLDLEYLLSFYKDYPDKGKFFLPNLFFDKLAGSDELRTQISTCRSEAFIRKSWQADLEAFKQIRKKYLLYEDF